MDWLASALAFALLHSIWQCALLAGAASLTLSALSSAAVRHAVAMGFLIMMALAPVAGVAIYLSADAPMPGGPLSAFFEPWLGPVAAPIIVMAWLCGVGFMLARYVVGYCAISAMGRQDGGDLPPEWMVAFEAISLKFGVAASAVVRVSDAVIVPCVTHVVRPIIWLPASLLTRACADQLEALLAHELAHIARKDWLWSGVQNLIEGMLFYHPAVWWLGARIRQERENACDDLAVALCGDAVALAEGLVGLEWARKERRIALAANGGALLQRITRLLEPAHARSWRGPPAFIGAVIIVFALCVGQAGAGGGRPHDLHVEASTSGAIGPGDYRQIKAYEDGRERFYRASIDADGRLTEIYREDGQQRSIDAEVRAWLEEVAS
jgi:beta-lactamase regulating signal transducer with metallopeptidase domain